MTSNKLIWFTVFMILTAIIAVCDDRKQPSGAIRGHVFLDPPPTNGQEWAYVRLYNYEYDVTVQSDPVTHEFFIDYLPVTGNYIDYGVEISRPGYFTHTDTIDVYVSTTQINYDITLHGADSSAQTFQDGVFPDENYAGCADTYISYPDSSTNHGTEPFILVSSENASQPKRGLIQFVFNFDAYFPQPESTAIDINSAVIGMYIDSVFTDQPFFMTLHNVEEGWLENRATWLSNGSDGWEDGPGGSFGLPASDTLTLDHNTAGWIEFDITSIVEGWFSGLPRNGMMIKLIDETQPSMVYIRSADSPIADLRPRFYLKISYSS